MSQSIALSEEIGRLERADLIRSHVTGLVRLDLVELWTDTHRAQVWMGPGQIHSIERGVRVEYRRMEGVLVLLGGSTGEGTKYVCEARRQLRPRPGEFAGWICGRWYALCAAWAKLMALEAFEASMEALEVRYGTARNVIPRQRRWQ